MKQKYRQQPTKKHKINTTTQKQKFAPEIFFKKRPLERRNDKKTAKDTDPDNENTKRQKRAAFPPWGNKNAMQKGTDRPRATTHHHKPKNNPNKNATDRHDTNQQTNERRRREGKRKRQVRGRRLGVVAELGVRVVDGVRVQQEENTRGNPNPKRGLGFPSA